MVAHPAPSVGLLAGEGGGGVALAPLVADQVVASTDAWLAPLSPEGAATVLHRDPSRAPEVAELQRLGADRLAELGLVDEVVADGHPATLEAHRDALGRALRAARAAPAEGREQRRERRFREALGTARGEPGRWGGDQQSRRRG
jgi:acetyl-CoA carboxylase carboxyl transferase subunit beta